VSVVPPPCPRCGTNLNVRRVPPLVRGWTCRWCRFEVWRRDVELQTRRTLAEAEKITKDAA
jgi:ribosomal protein L37AE/L43A